MISYASLAGSTVQVQPPTGSAITAQEISTQILGRTDAQGDGSTIVVTYEFVPPAGNWYAASPGTYTVELRGSPVKDLSGKPAAPGSAGTFQASVPPTLDVSPAVGSEPATDSAVSNSRLLTLSGYAEAGSTVKIENGTVLVGTTQAGADGSWNLTYQAPQDGTYNFTATASDSKGNTSAPSGASAIEVDTIPPTSTVAPLPATTTATTSTVSWSGTDGASGSGVALYDVYVSQDGGPFTLFQSETLATSATFTGLPGHTYGFYSVAIDYAGNVQPTPDSAQTTSTVTATPTPPPMIGGEQALLQRKVNRRGKPVGKPDLAGFVIHFTQPLDPSAAGDSANYQVDTVTTKRVKKVVRRILHPITSFSVVYSESSDSVTLRFAGKQAFRTGGQITVITGPPGGLTGPSGQALTGNMVFLIAPGGRSIAPG
jgi:hypothetical protein